MIRCARCGVIPGGGCEHLRVLAIERQKARKAFVERWGARTFVLSFDDDWSEFRYKLKQLGQLFAE